MNLDLKNLNTESIKALGPKVGTILINNRLMVASAVVLLVGGLVLLRIGSLISPEIDEDYLKSQSQTQEEIEFEEAAIEQLKALNDTRIQIEAQFVDRDNPFVNPELDP